LAKNGNNKISVQPWVKNLGTLCFGQPPPPPFPKKKKKKLAWKLTIQVENEKWTVHSPHTKHNLKYKTPLPPPTSKKREAL